MLGLPDVPEPDPDAPGPLEGFTWGEALAALRAAGRLQPAATYTHGLGQLVADGRCGWTLAALGLSGGVMNPERVCFGDEGSRDAVLVNKRCGAVPPNVPVRAVVLSYFDRVGRIPRVVRIEHTDEVWEFPSTCDGDPDRMHSDALLWRRDGKERVLPVLGGWRIVIGGFTIDVGDQWIPRCLLALRDDVATWWTHTGSGYSNSTAAIPSAALRRLTIYGVAGVPVSRPIGSSVHVAAPLRYQEGRPAAWGDVRAFMASYGLQDDGINE